MALTRKFLTALGIEADKVDEIIEAHVATVDAVKAERDAFKADAEKLPKVTQERDELKKALAEADSGEEYKKQFDKLKGEFEAYKKDIEGKAVKQSKTNAYTELLKAAGVSEKRIGTILKVSDQAVEALELDKDGKIKDADKLSESIKSEWSDFIVKEGTEGADTKKPPKNEGGSGMSKEDIMNIKDTGERQKAIAENHELFGI